MVNVTSIVKGWYSVDYCLEDNSFVLFSHDVQTAGLRYDTIKWGKLWKWWASWTNDVAYI